MVGYGELPVDEKGNKYILVFICAFSRYAKMVATADKSATTVARAFKDHCICTFGVPLVVVSNNGTEGERKCQNQMATKMPRRPNGDLNCSWEPNGNQNKPFCTPLGRHAHLGRHLVTIRL